MDSATLRWHVRGTEGHCEGQKSRTTGIRTGVTSFAFLFSRIQSYKQPQEKIGVYQAEELSDVRGEPGDVDDDNDFKDVEAFLSEYQTSQDDLGDLGTFTEEEAAKALAVSWSERRREIAKLKQSRQFGAAYKDRRSFRVEIEELKKKTRCRKCNKLGHWARECKAPNPDKSMSSSSSSGAPTGAGYVQVDYTGLESVMEVEEPEHTFVGTAGLFSSNDSEVLTGGLVSSPGFGVVDSGCLKTLIGEDTLLQLSQLIESKGYGPVKFKSEENVFRFGIA
jgi:hypothetical protein